MAKTLDANPLTALHSPLLSEIDTTVKQELSEELFGTNKCEDSFFTYYQEQCIEALADRGRLCSARTHQDVVDVVKLLESETRESILAELQAKYANREKAVSDHMLARTMDLAARISTMHQTGKWQTSVSGPNRLDWTTGMIRDCVEQFHNSNIHEHVQFESIFNVIALQRVAGFKIIWTDNLADHLVMNDLGMSQSIRVFHHASFLLAQKGRAVFPAGSRRRR